MCDKLKEVTYFDNFVTDTERSELHACMLAFRRRSPLIYHWLSMRSAGDVEELPSKRIVRNLALRIPGSNQAVGFEYWSVDLSEGERIDWHIDKDELLFWSRNGELNQPEFLAVLYLSPPSAGGALEIEGFGAIQAVPRRLVLVPGKVLHRVQPVLAGRRESVALSFWACIPLAYRADSNTAQH